MHFYTSINNAYLPKARILAKSVKEHCPGSFFSLVLSDVPMEGFDIHQEPFDEVITIQELGLPVPNLNLWIYLHSVVELCTAVKGQALRLFLERSEKVVYLDPDIVVYHDMADLDRLLDQHDVVLTPHQTVPEKNKVDVQYNEICSLQHGTYNFGFYAVRNSPQGIQFAEWFRDRLVDFCYDDIPNGLFTDQKWGDLAPALFDGVYIWRSPACNVCTWNLSNRTVSKNDAGTYLVNGEVMLFYHFSGFDSGAQKHMLDIYSNGNPLLYEMRDWYIQRMEEEGQERLGKRPSVYSFYTDGTKVGQGERLLLREREDVQKAFSQVNPYDKNDPAVETGVSYYQWYVANLAAAAPQTGRRMVRLVKKGVKSLRVNGVFKTAALFCRKGKKYLKKKRML